MNTNEKHIRDNKSEINRESLNAANTDNADMIANSLKANSRNRKRNSMEKTNRLWIWFGVLVLIIILLYWLFSIGLFEDLSGIVNG